MRCSVVIDFRNLCIGINLHVLCEQRMMISVIQVILTGIILGHDCIADQIQDQSCIGNTELFKKMLTSNKACN